MKAGYGKIKAWRQRTSRNNISASPLSTTQYTDKCVVLITSRSQTSFSHHQDVIKSLHCSSTQARRPISTCAAKWSASPRRVSNNISSNTDCIIRLPNQHGCQRYAQFNCQGVTDVEIYNTNDVRTSDCETLMRTLVLHRESNYSCANSGWRIMRCGNVAHACQPPLPTLLSANGLESDSCKEPL